MCSAGETSGQSLDKLCVAGGKRVLSLINGLRDLNFKNLLKDLEGSSVRHDRAKKPVLAVLDGQQAAVLPIWMMRQAGR